MGTEPSQAEGAAVCRFEGGGSGGGGEAAAAEKEDEEGRDKRSGKRETETGEEAFAAISYRLPHVSARMVPLLQSFCGEVFGGKGGGGGAGGGA